MGLSKGPLQSLRNNYALSLRSTVSMHSLSGPGLIYLRTLGVFSDMLKLPSTILLRNMKNNSNYAAIQCRPFYTTAAKSLQSYTLEQCNNAIMQIPHDPNPIPYPISSSCESKKDSLPQCLKPHPSAPPPQRRYRLVPRHGYVVPL